MAECVNQCVVCGIKFNAKQIRAKYCSNKCRVIAQRAGIAKQNIRVQKITDEQILVDITAGLTRQQIADKHGIHVGNLDRRMERLHVHAVRQTRIQKHTQITQPNWHWTQGKAEMVRKKQEGRFELVEFKKGRFRIKCVACGFVIERADSTVRQKKCLCDKCEERRKNEIELANERIKLMRSFYAIAELKKPKTCPKCGEVFFSENPDKIFCSRKCKEKAHAKRYRKTHKKKNINGHYSSRARKYGVRYESGITLIKVFNRDNGICKICGKPCDWNDHSWGTSFGALYPTIDHITALVNGGGHTWDNVQLAHAICNSYKRDLITA